MELTGSTAESEVHCEVRWLFLRTVRASTRCQLELIPQGFAA